ncbi:Hypothetical predicted protein [Scomber scombrus]|uniref:Uncharacterized protein n=1 Tax=Scomber scombrus TaxID=13677 RepID=A0AAV1QFC1_SCOSC
MMCLDSSSTLKITKQPKMIHWRSNCVTHSTEGDRQHRLHPAVLHRSHYALLVHQSAAGQRPELHVFDSHRHELGVRVWPELHHEDPVGVSGFTAHFGPCSGHSAVILFNTVLL